MLYRKLGASGIEASAIALGAWAIGGWMWGGSDERDAVMAIHAALDAGVTLIDTAPIYGFGRSEEIVGKALAGHRSRAVVATKCGLRWDLAKGELFFHSSEKGRAEEAEAERHIYRYLGAESIRHEVEQSLRRLRIDAIDLYQTHWQDPTVPTEDVMATLTALEDEGKIRAIGACNVEPAHLEAYTRASQLDAVQQHYSMIDRAPEREVLPFCHARGLAFLAYSPMALGLLTGKIGPERTFGEGDIRQGNPRFSAENRRHVRAMLSEIEPIAESHGLTLAQLVLAWTIHQPGVTHALAGARNPRQAEENAKAGEAALAPDELEAIVQALEKHREIV